MNRATELWVYLSASPLLWLTVTLAAYVVGDRISSHFKRHPLANPVVFAVTIVIVTLQLTGTDFDTYFEGAQFVHFLLGSATVALAVPLVENWQRVRRTAIPIVFALAAGSATAVVSAVGIVWLLGSPPEVIASIAPKSVTAPISMGIAEQFGGIPTLAAVLVIFTGLTGSIIVTPLLNRVGVRDYAARGFAVGIAAHGMGTARAFQVDPVAGTFAGIAMGLNGVLTALLVPLLARLFGG